MNPELKARLEALQAKSEADRTDAEKTELNLLVTIDKQDKQISEKDSLLGAKGTEIGDLKTKLETATGTEKTNLEQLLADKQDALDTLKAGLDALKEANTISKEAAEKISQAAPGHGDTVDPKEVEALESKAYANPTVREEFETLYKGLDAADKAAYKTDPAFKKLMLEQVLGTGGDEADDTPWGTGVKKEEGTPAESAEERMKRLFDQNQQNHRRAAPSSSGRGGRGRGANTAMPKAAEREIDTRSH